MIRDRIKELRRVKASELKSHPANWRTHPQGQQDAIRAILDEVGYAGALLARELPGGDLELIDGHLRAGTTPDEMVPVLVLDVDEVEAKKIMATFDPIAAMAEADTGKLDALLREVNTGSVALQTMLADLATQNDLYVTDVEPSIDDYKPPESRGIYAYRDDAVFSSSNEWGLPDLLPDMLSDQIPDRIWDGLSTDDPSKTLFVWASSRMTPDVCNGGILGFYVDDWRFDCVWVEAVRLLEKLIKFGWGSVIAPDFSVIGDTPRCVQMWQAYRSYWCARYWQEAGVRVIPNLVWSTEWADDWIWSPIPHGAPVISLQVRAGGAREKKYVGRAAAEAIRRLEPANVIVYGGDDNAWIDEVFPSGPIYHKLSSYTRVRMNKRKGLS